MAGLPPLKSLETLAPVNAGFGANAHRLNTSADNLAPEFRFKHQLIRHVRDGPGWISWVLPLLLCPIQHPPDTEHDDVGARRKVSEPFPVSMSNAHFERFHTVGIVGFAIQRVAIQKAVFILSAR